MPLIYLAPFKAVTNVGPVPTDTRLLMHFDGVNNGTIFTDECGNPQGSYSNVKTSTTQSKFGGSSLRCDVGSVIMPTTTIGTKDFTIEMWIMFDSVSGTQIFYDQRYGNGGTAPCLFWNGSTFTWWFAGGARFTGGTVTPNTWTHLAMSRTNNILRGFVNGIVVGTYTEPTASSGDTSISIAGYFSPASFPFKGYIDELRVCHNGLYTENFSPPTAPFTL